MRVFHSKNDWWRDLDSPNPKYIANPDKLGTEGGIDFPCWETHTRTWEKAHISHCFLIEYCNIQLVLM